MNKKIIYISVFLVIALSLISSCQPVARPPTPKNCYESCRTSCYNPYIVGGFNETCDMNCADRCGWF